ncbi:MAG TPA: DUF3857 domain-containing protein, partial [Saprospiraceae bacterium]|nr:DUF3857 domain-containing protein [Saprospiraceae bacterium]
MKHLIALLVMLIPFGLLAQKSPAKYGDIPMNDINMKTYDQDTTAAAVVLFDYGQSYVTVNAGTPMINIERHTRIKILKKEGLEWANGSILTYHEGSEEEKIIGLKATAYNLEGGKIVETKMGKESMFKEKFNRSWNRQKFTIPNVKVGSVIEYTYKKSSGFIVNFPNWAFQKRIPTRYSEYWAMFPKVFKFQQYMQGYVPVTTYEVNDQMYFGENVVAHHWISKNVPAFSEEEYMTTDDDFISQINFALALIDLPDRSIEIMGTWKKMNDDLVDSESFGGVLKGAGFLKDQVEQITTGMTDPIQKIVAISDWVKANVTWDGEMDYLADPLKRVVEKKKGTVGDVNLLFGSMLQKAGLSVDMVLLSTRDHGFIREAYPMRRQFNYVICQVRLDGKTLLLDATEKYLPYDILPSRCLNGKGLVISSTNSTWVDITTKGKARTVVSADLVLDGSGQLKGKLQYNRDGYDAQKARETYFDKGEEKYVKDFLASKSWNVGKSEFTDMKDLTKQARESHEVSIAEHSNVAGDVIYINPIVAAQMVENPFNSETRKYPINFGMAVEKTYMCKITLPEGYQIDEMPQNKLLALPGGAGRYTYNITQMGNVINLTSTFIVSKVLFGQDFSFVKLPYRYV